MGAQRCKQNGGTFSEYLYQTVQTIEYKGLRIKVIEKYGDTQHHTSLPQSAGKSDGYLRINGRTQQIEQLRIFSSRDACLDFDWGHPHGDLPKGTVHVHICAVKDGKLFRTSGKNVRCMNEQETAFYGDLIHMINPNIQF